MELLLVRSEASLVEGDTHAEQSSRGDAVGHYSCYMTSDSLLSDTCLLSAISVLGCIAGTNFFHLVRSSSTSFGV